MKIKRLTLALLGVVLAAAVVTSCSDQTEPATTSTDTGVATNDSGNDAAIPATANHPDLAAIPSADLSAAETDALLFMREEEKLAHDVYVALGEMWDLKVFENISRSETSHMEAVLELLDRYGLEDPAGDPGEFANPDLQVLYDELIALGSQSVADALVVGATIEDVDIADLQARIAQTDNEDIQLVFGNLLKGSQNHLRAFNRQLDRNGVEYQPQYLTQDEYDEIVSSTNGNT